MSERDLIALPCKLSRGVFSSERSFEVALANGEVYAGIAPRHFCWNAAGKLLGGDEATEDEVDGFVAARFAYEIDGTQVAVEVPDGAVLAVRPETIRQRPSPIVPPRAQNMP